MKLNYLVALVSLALVSKVSMAQDMVDKAQKKEVIDSVATLMKENYVFPEHGLAMAELLKKQLKSGAYKSITTTQGLSEKLTEDLQSVNQDKHIRVRFAPQRVKEMRQQQAQPESDDLPESYLKRIKRSNFGFQEVSIKSGNIGYINLTGFRDTSVAGDTAVAAMNMVANSDAIIFDLRKNGGGSPSMIQLITSYLMDEEPVHLNSFYWRSEDVTDQTWTLPHIQGKRNVDADVYILTSKGTFSAAEEFSYNLKHLKRATIIGETTGGGAHPGGSNIINDNFTVFIPSGRAINPITKTNWEGTGVKPHFEVASSKALDKAMLIALENLSKKFPDDQSYYQWHAEYFAAMSSDITLDNKTLSSYVGQYGPRNITLEGGELFYQRGKGNKYLLKALDQTTFIIPELDYFRLQLVLDGKQVSGLKGLYDNGRSDLNPRS